MVRRLKLRVVLTVAAVALLASAANAARSPATERGWQPAVVLTGNGDPTRAITAMRGAAELWHATLHHPEVDAQTSDFLARTMESLEDFDLRGMHELLPKQNGPFRELGVRGERVGRSYVVRRPDHDDFEVDPNGTRDQPGDSSLVIRSRGVPARDGDTNYLIQGRAGVVVGKIGWPMVTASNRAWLRMANRTHAADPAARPMVAIRQTAKQANPALGQEDLELVATLWEAFPRMSYLLSSVGRIDDLIASDADATTGVTHVRVVVSLDPARMRESYPDLADHLEGLGKLFRIDIDWVDSRGRTIARAHVNSEHLQARVELYTKDGLILPFKGSQVFVDDPIDPGQGPLRYSTRVRSDFRMMGMYSHMRGGRMDFEYVPTPTGMELRARMTHVPQITVDGAALGVLPPGLIDAFIPGNLHDLITEFLTTACTGNEGRGVAVTVRMHQRENGVSTLDGRIGFEALNNFLVKLGLRFFNDRVMPDEDVNADIRRLMIEAQGAFSADLDRYARAR